jgi:hypothetical protein
MDLVKIFWDSFPLSFALLFGVFVVAYTLIRKRTGESEAIENQVEVFFKGGTIQEFPATIDKQTMSFEIGEAKYREPITAKPRLKIKNVNGIDKIFRTFLYAEGLGTVDVPPLTVKGREAIIQVLKDNQVMEKKEDGSEYTDDELIEFIQFYNFDIEQITDRPMLRAFSTQMNMFSTTMEMVHTNLRKISGEGGTSMWRIVIICLTVFFFGLFAGAYLTGKGYM